MATTPTASIATGDIFDLKAMGEAIFAEWYPHWRNGDPVPGVPPLHLSREARELALQHRMVAARRRGQLFQDGDVQARIDRINGRITG